MVGVQPQARPPGPPQRTRDDWPGFRLVASSHRGPRSKPVPTESVHMFSRPRVPRGSGSDEHVCEPHSHVTLGRTAAGSGRGERSPASRDAGLAPAHGRPAGSPSIGRETRSALEGPAAQGSRIRTPHPPFLGFQPTPVVWGAVSMSADETLGADGVKEARTEGLPHCTGSSDGAPPPHTGLSPWNPIRRPDRPPETQRLCPRSPCPRMPPMSGLRRGAWGLWFCSKSDPQQGACPPSPPAAGELGPGLCGRCPCRPHPGCCSVPSGQRRRALPHQSHAVGIRAWSPGLWPPLPLQPAACRLEP